MSDSPIQIFLSGSGEDVHVSLACAAEKIGQGEKLRMASDLKELDLSHANRDS